jgi:hypothetical protein
MPARKKPENEKIKHVVQVLLTARDDKRLRKHAQARGTAVSSFVRGLILDAIADR